MKKTERYNPDTDPGACIFSWRDFCGLELLSERSGKRES